MLSIHRINSIRAHTSVHLPDANWLILKFTAKDGESTDVVLYFESHNRGFAEEASYAKALAAAINAVEPIPQPVDESELEPDDDSDRYAAETDKVPF